MESYICDRCSKEFRSNAGYKRHLHKITPCDITEIKTKKKTNSCQKFFDKD